MSAPVVTHIAPQEIAITAEHVDIEGSLPHSMFLMHDPDLSMRVEADRPPGPDGKPRRHDHEAGMVLFVLGVDEDHDQVFVQPGRHSRRFDMVETLRETIETAQHCLDALTKIEAASKATGAA